MTPRPKDKTLKRRVSKDAQLIKRQSWTAPDAADAALLLNNNVVPALGETVTTFLAQPDFARQIRVICVANTGDVKAGSVVITGTDIDGNTITDSLVFTDNLATAVTSVKAFKTVTSILWPAQDGATGEWDVGTTDALGLEEAMQEDSVLHTIFNSVVETTRPTVVYNSTDKTKNLLDPNSALDGSKDVVAYYAYPFPS